jgi:hypothetical protein
LFLSCLAEVQHACVAAVVDGVGRLLSTGETNHLTPRQTIGTPKITTRAAFLAATHRAWAPKEFDTFPEGDRLFCLTALTIAAEGGKADISKPMYSTGSGVFEIALPFRGTHY